MKIEYLYKKEDIYGMLQDPDDNFRDDFDEPIVKFIGDDADNPIFLMVGCDENTNDYYFTFENNETFEDFYCKDGDLAKMFNEIMQGKGEYEIWVKG